MARMKLKKLEEYLQGVDDFDKPKIYLEQYITPPHIAACFMYNIQTGYDDIENKLVADLGCGGGMLSIGAFLLGAQLTIGFDIDADALQLFRGNVMDMDMPGIDCVQQDVSTLSTESNSKWNNIFDTVVTNPPFGTKLNEGIDVKFVENGLQMATNAVYSMHKTSTRAFIKKKIKDWGVTGEVMAELRYNIDASYKFHKSKSVDIAVDVWRFDVKDL